MSDQLQDVEIKIDDIIITSKEDLRRRGVVYKIKFPNGKVYIGKTERELLPRIKAHVREATVYKKTSPIAKAIRRYKKLDVGIMFQVSNPYNMLPGCKDILANEEAKCIEAHRSHREGGYNTNGGSRKNLATENTTPVLDLAQEVSELRGELHKTNKLLKRIFATN